jgi:hypothetical protein
MSGLVLPLHWAVNDPPRIGTGRRAKESGMGNLGWWLFVVAAVMFSMSG